VEKALVRINLHDILIISAYKLREG